MPCNTSRASERGVEGFALSFDNFLCQGCQSSTDWTATPRVSKTANSTCRTCERVGHCVNFRSWHEQECVAVLRKQQVNALRNAARTWRIAFGPQRKNPIGRCCQFPDSPFTNTACLPSHGTSNGCFPTVHPTIVRLLLKVVAFRPQFALSGLCQSPYPGSSPKRGPRARPTISSFTGRK